MGPSILIFLFRGLIEVGPGLFLILFISANSAHGQSPAGKPPVHGQRSSAKLTPKIPASKAAPMFNVSELNFLQRAEEIEREAWWVLTEKRIDPATSPFRVFRVALLQDNPQFKTKLSLRFCRRLQVHKIASEIWRVESLCQKPSREVGTLQKLTPRTWKVQWQMSQFENHFGLGATIFYPKLSCEIDINEQGRVEIMKCPLYSRNRNEEEIIELSTFHFTSKGKALLKLKGEIKKDLQVVGTLETEVPLSGDVVVKEKRLPQKPIEGETDFSNTEVSQKPDGKKGGRGNEGKVESSQQNQQGQSLHTEGYSEGPIGIQGPQGSSGQPQFTPPLQPPEYGPPIGEEGGYPLYAPPVHPEPYPGYSPEEEDGYQGPPLIVEPIRIGPPPIEQEGEKRD